MNIPVQQLPPLSSSLLQPRMRSISEGIARKCNVSEGRTSAAKKVESREVKKGLTLADLLESPTPPKKKSQSLAEAIANKQR